MVAGGFKAMLCPVVKHSGTLSLQREDGKEQENKMFGRKRSRCSEMSSSRTPETIPAQGNKQKHRSLSWESAGEQLCAALKQNSSPSIHSELLIVQRSKTLIAPKYQPCFLTPHSYITKYALFSYLQLCPQAALHNQQAICTKTNCRCCP